MGSYTQQQELKPWTINLGAAIAAGTNETWGLGTLPTDIPTFQIKKVTLQNGANVTANATDFNVFLLVKGTNTTMATLNAGATNLVEDTAVDFTMSTTPSATRLEASSTLKLTKTATLNGTAGATTAQCILTIWYRTGSDDLLQGL
jgi:hypothetical protein